MSDYISKQERLRRIGEVLLRGVYLYLDAHELDAYEKPIAVEESAEGNHREVHRGCDSQGAVLPIPQRRMLPGHERRNEALT
jgi:hypothetical protein